MGIGIGRLVCDWVYSILNTAGRKTVSLAVSATAHALVIVVEVPVPHVRRRAPRRRPEVGVVSEKVEIATVVPVAARKGSESIGVGCPGIW